MSPRGWATRAFSRLAVWRKRRHRNPACAVGWDHTSCRYLESGLSFYSNKITACGVVHHGTGTPQLAPFSGGLLPLQTLDAQRAALIRINQIGGESVCRNCPNLERKIWPKPTGQIDWIGITHFNACNNGCDYCWLQWAENGRGKPNYPGKTYSVTPAIDQLIAAGRLSPDAIVDYGGGGEPTLMPEFDDLLARFTRCRAEQWLHTNGVRLPEPIARGYLDFSRLHVVCSVDAGTAETYFRVKQRHHFETVWAHLEIYRSRGATVIAKYIMQENNCACGDIAGFVQHAKAAGIAWLQWDIDLRFPEPRDVVIQGLAQLHAAARSAGIKLTPANIGLKSAVRAELLAKIADAQRAI